MFASQFSLGCLVTRALVPLTDIDIKITESNAENWHRFV